jgi:hypothetical protein
MRSPRETRGIGRWGFRSLVLERVSGIDLRSSVIDDVREEIEGVPNVVMKVCWRVNAHLRASSWVEY